MEQQPQIYRLHWQGIEIEARYWPRRWGAMAHLEIESMYPERSPLPITSSGYRSHFHQPGTIEAHLSSEALAQEDGGDVAAQVIAWLNEEAAKPEWQAHVERSRQGELF